MCVLSWRMGRNPPPGTGDSEEELAAWKSKVRQPCAHGGAAALPTRLLVRMTAGLTSARLWSVAGEYLPLLGDDSRHQEVPHLRLPPQGTPPTNPLSSARISLLNDRLGPNLARPCNRWLSSLLSAVGRCVVQTEQELVKAQERIDDGTVGTYESRSAELGLDLDTRTPPRTNRTRSLTHAPACAFAAVGIPAVHVPVCNDDGGQESGAAWRGSGGEALAVLSHESRHRLCQPKPRARSRHDRALSSPPLRRRISSSEETQPTRVHTCAGT